MLIMLPPKINSLSKACFKKHAQQNVSDIERQILYDLTCGILNKLTNS